MKKDTLETLYQAGIGSRNLRNFEYGYFMPTPFSFESSFEDDLDDSNDDQDSTDYENEEDEVPGVRDKCAFLEFRSYVKAKKEELKAQYGKGHISVFECGIMPWRENPLKYNPIAKVPTVYWPSKDCGLNPDLRPTFWHEPCLCDKGNCDDCKVGAGCCRSNQNKDSAKDAAWAEFTACREQQGKVMTQGNEQAYDNATARFNADKAAWDKCRAENKGVWVPGWRRKWREFKKAGGLIQLRDMCRGVQPPPPPPPTTPPTGPDSGLSCQGLSDTYGMIAGLSWGKADPGQPSELSDIQKTDLRNEWIRKSCKTRPTPVETGDADTGSKPGLRGRGTTPDVADTEKNKKMMIYGAIALVVIIAIILIVRMMRAKGN